MMSPKVKREIDKMRLDLVPAKQIAETLGIHVGTVRSYIRRHPEIENARFCLTCGIPVVQTPGRKAKKFCSDKCRMKWWNKHQDHVNRKAYYTLTCIQCGKEFQSYGNQKRKYCGRECYTEARSIRSRQPDDVPHIPLPC